MGPPIPLYDQRILEMLMRSWLRAAATATACLGVGFAAAEEPRPPQGGPSEDVGQALREAWPDRPEWLDMYTAILNDEPMGPTNGWFRSSATQTRYGWDATRKKFDRDGDGRVSREEYPGGDDDFARLDRDHDKSLSAADFDFSKAYSASPGSMLFSKLDRDGSGKVTKEEIEAFFKAADSDDAGFLSRLDLEQALPMPSTSMGPGDRPSKTQLIRGLFRQEIGSLQSGPKLDESAPDFTLKTNDGKSELTLSKLIGPKPIVLIFGNFTCGPFRSHSGNFEKLHRRYGDRATFVMVYVREAHPTDGWRMQSNDRLGVSAAQPQSYDERAQVAQRCGKLLELGFPMLVDTIDDAVGAQYSGMPGRFYLIDKAGKIAFKNARGPFGFKPTELEQSLILLLQEEGASRGQQANTQPAAVARPNP
jgi:thiol-disulfide isomerase/thioredoxin